MRTSTFGLSLAAGLAVALGTAAAQAPPTSPSPSPSPVSAPAAEGGDTIRSILERELSPPPGGYTYNAQGRRDPFVSLLKPVGPDQGPRTRKAGMEGFLIQEVALKGIVKTQEGYIAMLEGPDATKSYFARVGQRFFDGQIIAMDASNVSFRQDITDPLSPVKTREVKKSLYPSEEAKR